VSKRFSSADEDGKVTTKGSRVSFSFRMVTTEAPVLQLDDATELHVIGEQDDWWRVRLPMAEAWLPQAEVQIGDQTDAQLKIDHAAIQAKYDAEVNARIERIAAEKERQAKDAADAAAVQVVSDAFQKELDKPVGEQQLPALLATLDKVDGTLAEESSAKGLVTALRQRIQTQQWIVEATLVSASEPVRSEPAIEPLPKDRLERFQAIGWLRYESQLGGSGTYYLEKGGLRLYNVTCSTGRYELAMFIDCELGLNGPRRRPSSESFSVLDVERIEVLGRDKR
ncbi:MAG: hypothetical protein KDC98_03045, partial [Planctomycetes bacterium]|nr:hypothetical protein [Planctomycetota bacterium]